MKEMDGCVSAWKDEWMAIVSRAVIAVFRRKVETQSKPMAMIGYPKGDNTVNSH